MSSILGQISPFLVLQVFSKVTNSCSAILVSVVLHAWSKLEASGMQTGGYSEDMIPTVSSSLFIPLCDFHCHVCLVQFYDF